MVLAPLACGGGGAGSDGAKAPAGASPAAADSASGASPAAATAPTGSAVTTTTTALGTGGDLQGAKLTETHTVAATSSASAGPAEPKPHGKEPGRGPDDIRAIIMARRDQARACYEAGLKDHPGLEGNLVIQWTIDPKGNVTQTSLDASGSQIAEPGVVSCISDVIKAVQFAASPGGYETHAFYPFNFHPHHHGAATTAP